MKTLSIALIIMLLIRFLITFVEFFDQWQQSNPLDASENAVFEFMLAFCLALLVYKLIAAIAALITHLPIIGLA